MLALSSAAVSAFIAPSSFPALDCDNNLILAGVDYRLADYQQSLFSELAIPFPASLSRAVNKRQSEYLAGRYAAIQALAGLGITTRDIPTGEHRSPVWPKGVLASITHTSTSAFCVAAGKQTIKYLGIDHENWLKADNVAEIKNSIINEKEEVFLKQSDMSFEQAFTLVFSAKESLFKALYPSVGYYFDFSAAQIIDLNTENHSFCLRLTETLTPALTAGASFNGQFIFDESAVQTLICEPC
ncbi:4'-phosphopantetheinyl transferase family protein [Thalassomonas actiniarum]|uniref:Enterobactin synthase component D n=1 Tax=Thalassomonas actiniarum TaxID=485447 RepID=A0AAE9YUM3_9GAMM|nr:4'-phosphopantetheinyl transferase superfamily protein [Thalassomonas actiniarum]WDE01128.1 4'-phosphopantetheinyl transferase superfamily protein [Thalassomonas actiniarum]